MAETKPRAKKAPLRWTKARETKFLETLAQTCNVAASERKAKMPVGSAYRHRRKSPEFDARWQEALAEGYARLELTMLQRALAGVSRRVTKTESGSETVEYSDRLGMALLAAHRATVTGGGRIALLADDDIKARLAAKIADMSRRMRDEG
jgi:hypothetical protein